MSRETDKDVPLSPPLFYRSVLRNCTRRRLAFFVTVAAVVYASVAGVLCYPPNRLRQVYLAEKCAAYVPPSSQLLYEEHHDSDVQWSAKSLELLPMSDPSGTRRVATAPRCLLDFAGSGFPERAPLFLGKLRTASGEWQTVMLYIADIRTPPRSLPEAGNSFTPKYCRDLGSHTLSADGALDPLGEGRYSSRAIAVFSLFGREGPQYDKFFAGKAKIYRFYAGQRDAYDQSRFAVDLCADDARVRLHGQLIDRSHVRIHFEFVGDNDA